MNLLENKSSLLQILEKEGIEANIFDKLVAANDSGYIPAMAKILLDLVDYNSNKITKKNAIKLIKKVREMDRKYLGITKIDEKESIDAIKNQEKLYNGELTIIRIPHSKASVVVDMMHDFSDWYQNLYYPSYENLLIISENGESNFYGNPDFCKKLKEKYPEGWTAGYNWNDIDGKEYKSEKVFFGGYINQDELEIYIKNNIINYLSPDDSGIIELDNGDLLLNKYGKYNPNITFIFDKKQYFSGGLEDKSLVYNDTNNISKQFNLEGNNGELKIIDGDYWKSKKGTNCFRPKKGGKHYLIEENWGGAHRKSYGRSFDSNKDGILYYRRASSNGGGTGYDYAIVKKDYKRKVSLDDI